MASSVGGSDGNRAYNECLVLALEGALDSNVLAQALSALVRRHEALRGVFSPGAEHFLVFASGELPLTVHDLSGLTPEAREHRQAELERNEVETEFDLQAGPLARANLIRLTPDRHRLVLSIHHAACDGWSAALLMQELAALYTSGIARGSVSDDDAGLPSATSFVSYAAEQRARAASAEGQRDVDFWMRELAGDLVAISLPTDRERSDIRSYKSRRIDIPLPPQTLLALRQTGAKLGCTFSTTFIGLVQLWLARRTGQSDLILGVPAAGQSIAEAEALVGHCVHLLPLRTQVDLEASFATHLKQLKPRVLDAFDHQQVTFSALLPKLKLVRKAGRLPLVPVCVNLDRGLGQLKFGEATAQFETLPRAFESFELFLNAVDHGEQLVIECSYNEALFDEATIRRWVRELSALAAGVAHDPEARVAGITLQDEADKRAFAQLNATEQPRTGASVHALVERCAHQTPEAPAIRFGSTALSYADLDGRANQLAHLLMGAGVAPSTNVGVCLSRNEWLPVVLLAILKCGAAYVPLEPTLPVKRLEAMTEDASVRVVLTDAASRAAAPQAPTLLLLEEMAQGLSAAPRTAPQVIVNPETIAYILFTSGSTGRPKGVMIPHSAFANILLSMQLDPGFGARDALLATTTIGFDIAGVELFLPLVSGGSVVLASREQATDPEALSALLEDRTITFMQATPATWFMLLEIGWKGRSDLRVVCTGEAFPESLRLPLLSRVDAVWNMYGPTETCIYSTIKRVVSSEGITIGKPVANTQVYVVDANLQPVPVDEVGELCIAGSGVALGYVQRPELTRERFLADPFVAGQRMYRTGDLGRLLSNGDLLCLGRIDSQVKIRGYRIELGEIETVLSRVPGVKRAAVVVKHVGDDPRLVAYAAVDPDSGVDQARALAALRAELPPYMIPSHVMFMRELPLSSNGKIARDALPAPVALSGQPVPATEQATPRGSVLGRIEQDVARIWEEILNVPNISRSASFLQLGGHSVLAVRVVGHLREHFGVDVPLRMLFEGRSIADVAERILSLLPTDQKSVMQNATSQTTPEAFMHTQQRGNQPTISLESNGSDPELQKAIFGLRKIWQAVLVVDELDEELSFFEAGGHSMLAVGMASRIRESIGVEVPLRVIFQARSFKEIASHVLDALAAKRPELGKVAREEIEF
jgi:amino acid adenylation domain-containing protein